MVRATLLTIIFYEAIDLSLAYNQDAFWLISGCLSLFGIIQIHKAYKGDK